MTSRFPARLHRTRAFKGPIFAFACFVLLLAPALSEAATDSNTQGPPVARKEGLVDHRLGVTYTDPYRWMENADDPRLYRWLRAEAAYTDEQTAGPLRDALEAEFTKIFSGDTGSSIAADMNRVVERKVLRRSLKNFNRGESGRSALEAGPSPSGRYEVVITPGNTDIEVLRIRDTTTGYLLDDYLVTKFSIVLWDDGEKSFVYGTMRDGRLSGQGFVIRRHVLGTSQIADTTLLESKDAAQDFLLYRDGGPTWLLRLGVSENRLSSVDLQTGEERVVFTTPEGVFTPFAFQDGLFWAVSFIDRDMGEIVTFDPVARRLTTVVPAGPLAVDTAALIGRDVYITYVRNGADELVRFETETGKTHAIGAPEPGSIVVTGIDSATGRTTFKLYTWVRRGDVYSYDPSTEEVRLEQAGTAPDVELEAVRIQYTPHAGWRAPLWVVKRKDVALTADTPMYMYGYGGFRANTLPYFSAQYLPWLRRGGAVAFVVLPGGLEMGEAWHMLGVKERKRNVFDAFAAAGRLLIAKGWTSRQKLVITGASNGGLLAAATARFYPNLFRASVPYVGVQDMGRFALFGLGCEWNAEYGDRDVAEEFRLLLENSPYQSLADGARYPSMLVVTSDLDDRVNPAHSYKFLARLQAVHPETRALFHLVHGTGHNVYAATVEENVRTASIVWSFVMSEVGMQ